MAPTLPSTSGTSLLLFPLLPNTSSGLLANAPLPLLSFFAFPSLAGVLRATGISLAVVFLVVPGVYYSYCETIRAGEIRKRRQRFELKKAERERRKVIEGVAEGKEEEQEVCFGYDRPPLEEEELEEIKRAYGSFAVGGRWSNAFGPEWREQGGEF